MPKFKIEVGWKHTIIDTATIEVEAENEKDAVAAALELAKSGKNANGAHIEWDDGEVVDAEYVTGKWGPH